MEDIQSDVYILLRFVERIFVNASIVLTLAIIINVLMVFYLMLDLKTDDLLNEKTHIVEKGKLNEYRVISASFLFT